MHRIPFLSLLLCASLAAYAGDHRAKSTGKAGHPPTQISDEGNLLRLNYEGFTVWLDCEQRGAVKWRYNAQHDGGNQPRVKDFKLDPAVPKECQQTSAKGYGHGYDRGHQVPANHLDASAVAIKEPLNKSPC